MDRAGSPSLGAIILAGGQGERLRPDKGCLLVGGKPIVSLPPFVVIGFETTILLGALSTVLGMFLNARLPRLGRSPGYDPRFSSDKIGIVAFGGPAQLDGAREVLRDAGAEEVKDV